MNRRKPVAAMLAVLGYVIMIVPILFVVATAFSSGRTLRFPPEGFSLRWFEAAVTYDPFMESLVSSLELAVAATALALLIGVPATLAVHRGKIPGRGLVEGLFLSPLIVPELVVGLALYQQLMIGLGLDNMTTLLVGHTALMLPYAVRVTGASLALADPALEEAARGLGASPVRAFFTVTLPLLRPGIFSAGLLGFVTSLEEFTEAVIDPFTDATGIEVEVETGSNSDRLSQLQAAGDKSGADVMLISDYYAALGQSQNLFQKVDAASVPSLGSIAAFAKEEAYSGPAYSYQLNGTIYATSALSADEAAKWDVYAGSHAKKVALPDISVTAGQLMVSGVAATYGSGPYDVDAAFTTLAGWKPGVLQFIARPPR